MVNFNLDENIVSQITVHHNLSQEIIVTNADKVKILLNDHHCIVKKKIEWINPVGIFLSVLTTIITAKFEDYTFGMKPEFWAAIFYLALASTFVWSSILIYNAIKYRNKGTIDGFIEKLKINSN